MVVRTACLLSSSQLLAPSSYCYALARAVDCSRRRRRFLWPRPRQPRSTPAHRHAVPGRARLLARARLRPGAAGRRHLHPRGEHLLRDPGAPPRGAHRPPRRLRPSLRHQHRLALRPRLPHHAAGQGARRARGRGRSVARRVAGGTARDVRLRDHRARVGVCRGTGPQGHAPRRAPLDARRHRAQLHLARVPLPHLRTPRDRPDDAGDRDADVLRAGTVQGTSAGRCGGGRRGHAHRVDDRPRPGRDATCRGHAPPAGTALRRFVRLAQRRAPRAVSLGHRRDEPLQRARVAAEHRVGRSGGRRL